MKLILFYAVFFTSTWLSDESNIIKNFVVFLNGNNLSGSYSELLAELIASPIFNNTPRILPEDDVLLNYSIKFPFLEDPINIDVSSPKKLEKYTIDYFRNLIEDKSLNIEVLPLALLHLLLQKSPPFTDILMVTDAQPELINNFLQDVLHLMKNKMINVIVTTIDALQQAPEEISNLYYSVQRAHIPKDYHRINRLTKLLRSESFFTTTLKKILSVDNSKHTRKSTITVINGLAFYKNLQIWDFALHVGVFMSEFNQTQTYSYNGQTIWIDDFLVLYAFENDITLKINLRAKYIPGPYIDVLTYHCKNHEIHRKMSHAMRRYQMAKRLSEEEIQEYWEMETKKFKFPLKTLVKALIDSLPRSVIYLMTDVLPTNIDLMPSILKLMEDKSITVVVTYYGEEYDPTPQEYVQINKASIIAL